MQGPPAGTCKRKGFLRGCPRVASELERAWFTVPQESGFQVVVDRRDGIALHAA